MPKARFAVELPPDTWSAEVSRSFPDARLRLLTGITVDERAVELGEVRGAEADAVDAAIADHPDVLEHERLYAADERTLAQYATNERALYEFLRRSSVPPEFPIVVEDGWFRFEVTASRGQIREVESILDRGERPYEVLAVVGSPDSEGLLTERQRELLETAVRSGYFEVPRECTLAELAAETGVDKSTASGIVRRGEARLVTWFLTGSGGIDDVT